MSFMSTSSQELDQQQDQERQQRNDDNAFKILIATDNHIGYLENDPVRGQDSFKSFEEILKIAVDHNVDFILLGGDLFHANRPSRSCLYKTMTMLRRHCFGERESKVWIASDQSVHFSDEFCKANYLDENLNISMPVFSIHGNHDDPSGLGNLCALNLLQVSGMINYFGASNNIEDVEVNPILMTKGSSKLALYGLGNIREERLHRQFRSGRVKFMRPSDDPAWRDCFNMFVFHQNRARHGPTSHIPEEFLDGFLDLVVWGHEHECRIFPEQHEHFAVTQPGSSVATSLSQGEAEPKHVGILTVEENGSYHLDKIALKTVRPLQFTSVVLQQVADLRPSGDAKQIQTYLEGVVEQLIERAKLEWEENHLPEEVMPIPLVRIRVDYTGGYETFNPQQFGQKFIKRVANPKDMLKFQREKISTSSQRIKASDILNDLTTAIPERLDTLKVEDLVNEYLQRDLFILPETKLEEAVMSLVEKSDKDAIRRFVKESVSQTRDSITVVPEHIDDLNLDFVKRKSTESKQTQDTQHNENTSGGGRGRRNNNSTQQSNTSTTRNSRSMLSNMEVDGGTQEGSAASVRNPSLSPMLNDAVTPIPSQQDSEEFNDDNDSDRTASPPPPAPPTSTARRGRGRGRGSSSTTRGSSGTTIRGGRGRGSRGGKRRASSISSGTASPPPPEIQEQESNESSNSGKRRRVLPNLGGASSSKRR